MKRYLVLALLGSLAKAGFAQSSAPSTLIIHDVTVIDATGAAMACLAVWWRRRWPLGVGLAVLAVLTVSPAALLRRETYCCWKLTLIRLSPMRNSEPSCSMAARTRSSSKNVPFVESRSFKLITLSRTSSKQ